MSNHKTIKINHHKYKEPVELGKIPNNEKCRMIVQLLKEKHELNSQLTVMAKMLKTFPDDQIKEASEKVKKELEKADVKS